MRPKRFVPAPPIAPGDVLRRRILRTLGISQDELADAMQVSRFSVNQIINQRRSITPEMAVRIARVTSTTADFWLNLQRDLDLYHANLKLADTLSKLRVLRKPIPEQDLFLDIQD